MAAVKCSQRDPALTATLAEGQLKVSHGADFRSTCRELMNPLAADLIIAATECGAMPLG